MSPCSPVTLTLGVGWSQADPRSSAREDLVSKIRWAVIEEDNQRPSVATESVHTHRHTPHKIFKEKRDTRLYCDLKPLKIRYTSLTIGNSSIKFLQFVFRFIYFISSVFASMYVRMSTAGI